MSTSYAASFANAPESSARTTSQGVRGLSAPPGLPPVASLAGTSTSTLAMTDRSSFSSRASLSKSGSLTRVVELQGELFAQTVLLSRSPPPSPPTGRGPARRSAASISRRYRRSPGCRSRDTSSPRPGGASCTSSRHRQWPPVSLAGPLPGAAAASPITSPATTTTLSRGPATSTSAASFADGHPPAYLRLLGLGDLLLPELVRVDDSPERVGPRDLGQLLAQPDPRDMARTRAGQRARPRRRRLHRPPPSTAFLMIAD